MEEEIWRPIFGFDRYEVSNLGRIRKIGFKYRNIPKLLTPAKTKHGYLQIGLTCFINGFKSRKYIKIHCLVLEAFVSPRPLGLVADHIDRNRENNKITNLRWVTVKQNCENRVLLCGDNNWTRKFPERLLRGDKHPSRAKPERRPKGSKHWSTVLTEDKVKEIKSILISKTKPIKDVALQFGISVNVIQKIRLNTLWKHVPWPNDGVAPDRLVNKKLQEKDVKLIKLCLALGVSGKECSNIFDAHIGTISNIKVGKSFKYVSWPNFYCG